MKKDKTWLENEIRKEAYKETRFYDPITNERKMAYRDVLELVNQLELNELEEVVIPKFVAEFIENCKNTEMTLYGALIYITEEMQRYVFENEELFVRAWLAYPNIEIEKEPRWVVKYREVDGGRYYVASNGNAFSFYEEDGVLHSNPRSLRSQSAYKFAERSKAEAVALLIGGEVEVAE